MSEVKRGERGRAHQLCRFYYQDDGSSEEEGDDSDEFEELEGAPQMTSAERGADGKERGRKHKGVALGSSFTLDTLLGQSQDTEAKRSQKAGVLSLSLRAISPSFPPM